MANALILTPIAHVSHSRIQDPDTWSVFVDHVDIKACPRGWPPNDIIVFRADKRPGEALMVPEAHFYGPRAYGMLLHHDWLLGEIDYQTVRHASHDSLNQRKMTLVLCQANGDELPEMSPEYYPTSKTASCPVSYGTFLETQMNDRVCLIPDPSTVDPNTTPRNQWVYAVANHFVDNDECPHAVHMHVQTKLRNHVNPSGRTIKYTLRGPLLQRKIVQTPMTRDAGYHTAPGPMSRERAIRNTQGRRLNVTTKKIVLPNQDFKVGGVEVRVGKITPTGFQAHRLLAREAASRQEKKM